jgi:hypothetical protein
LATQLENLLDEPLSNLDVDLNLNKIDCQKLLILHDEKDRILPYSNSQTVIHNTADSYLVTLEKVRYYKMRWSDEVIEHIVPFISEGVE